MTFKELQHVSRKVRAAATLEVFAPRKVRRTLKEMLVLITPMIIVFSMFIFDESPKAMDRLFGIVFAFIFFGLILFMIDFFFYSMYFRGVHTTVPELGFSPTRLHIPFEVLYIAFCTNPDDVTEGFVNSAPGQAIFSRLDISKKSTEQFLVSRKNHIKGERLVLPKEPTLAAYVGALYDADPEFSKFLGDLGFRRVDVTAVTDWIARNLELEKSRLRWWGRDALGKVRGIGKDWDRVQNHNLAKYGHYLARGYFSPQGKSFIKEVNALERILTRSAETNALIVAHNTDVALNVVHALAEHIESGAVLPSLEHKRIFLLDVKKLVKSTSSKTDLSRELSNTLHEAENAEHIIFVIPNFASLILSAESFDIDVAEIFDSHLRSQKLQIVALSDKKSFIEHLEKNIDIMTKFEKVIVSGLV